MNLPASTYSTHADMIRAAASYFGIPPEQLLLGSEFTAGGTMNVTLKVALTLDDMHAITSRAYGQKLDKLQEELLSQGKHPAQQEPPAQPISLEEVARNEQAYKDNDSAADQRAIILQLRGEYDQATHAERKGRSRWQYVVDRARELDEHTAAANSHDIPEHVWLDAGKLTDQQRAMSLGFDMTTGKYAMDPADITPEQRAELGLA